MGLWGLQCLNHGWCQDARDGFMDWSLQRRWRNFPFNDSTISQTFRAHVSFFGGGGRKCPTWTLDWRVGNIWAFVQPEVHRFLRLVFSQAECLKIPRPAWNSWWLLTHDGPIARSWCSVPGNLVVPFGKGQKFGLGAWKNQGEHWPKPWVTQSEKGLGGQPQRTVHYSPTSIPWFMSGSFSRTAQVFSKPGRNLLGETGDSENKIRTVKPLKVSEWQIAPDLGTSFLPVRPQRPGLLFLIKPPVFHASGRNAMCLFCAKKTWLYSAVLCFLVPLNLGFQGLMVAACLR